MDTQIREDKVLEFKALTVTKGIFNQMRLVKPDEVGNKAEHETKFIGWVEGEVSEHYIGEAHGTLVRVTRMDMWDWMGQLAGREALKAEAESLGIGPAQLVNLKLDEYRNHLRQIFIK